MDDFEYLPLNVTVLTKRIRQKFGTPRNGWRYSTYEEAMEEDRELNAQREISAWFRKLKADDWKINGIPLGSLD